MEPAWGRWRLILGLAAFSVWAPPALVGLPFAALLVASRPKRAAEWGVAAVAGVASATLLLQPTGDLLTAVARAYIVLVTAAFLGSVLLGPSGFLRQALSATLVGGAAALGLARIAVGRSVWEALHWEATREASWTMRLLVEARPEIFAVFEPVVRFVSNTVPATLALQTLAGLALAWQWHIRVAQRPLGPALAPFREFRFSEHWVWAVVASLTVWITPVLAGLKTTALNVAVVMGALYLLRGTAIVLAFAGALGVSVATLAIGAVAAAVLAVPLLLLVPGLATLGVTDTWLEFRRRLRAG